MNTNSKESQSARGEAPSLLSWQQEWSVGSAVDSEIIALNVLYLERDEPYRYLLHDIKAISGKAHPDAQWRWARKRYSHVEHGGWWCDGLDPHNNWQPMQWGCFKPNKPRTSFKAKGFETKGKIKPIKYEHPPKTPTRAVFLRVPDHIWVKVAERYNAPIGSESTFWEWVQNNKVPIIIVEGVKKAGALLTLGYAAISIPGITTGWRTTARDAFEKATVREPHPDLKPFNDGREITIAFDYREGDFFNSVEWRSADTLGWVLGDSKVFVAQLPGPQKGIDDFIAAGGDAEEVLAEALPINKLRTLNLWGLRRHEVAWHVNIARLGTLPFPNSGIVGVQSPKGTGKTYGLKELCRQAEREGRKVLLITHRIVLGRAICDAVGLTWIEDKYNSNEDYLETELLGYGLCVDSLHPLSKAHFDPTEWEGAIVIIDECEQVSWHLLNSSTCQDNRVIILDTFKELVNIVLDTDGLIILQDADLSDLSFDFVLGMKEGDKPQPWIACNSYKPQEPWKVRFYDVDSVEDSGKDDPSGLLRDAVAEVNRGGKIWFQTDSQKPKSTWGTVNLERFFRAKCPDKRILRIDQTTVGNQEHPAFECAAKLQGNNSLAEHYDIVLCSPTLATGVSIDLRSHFTAVVGIFQGTCSENEVRQALARVREPIPRWVWVRKSAVAFIGNGSSLHYSVANSKEKEVRQNLQLLKNYGFDFDLDFDRGPFRVWAKMAARINASAWDFRNAVAEGLKAEGHCLLFTGGSDSEVLKGMKALRIDSQIEEAINVPMAKTYTGDEYEESKKKRVKTDAERFAEEKFELKQAYNVEVTPELRQLSQDKWYPKIQLHYYLTCGAEYLKMRDWKHFNRQIENGSGKVCPQDVRLLSLRVKTHELLNTLQFTDPSEEWTKDSPAVQEFIKKALYLRRDIKNNCGITVSEQRANTNPVGIVQDFLKQLGFRLKGEQRRQGDKRERVYRFGGYASANVFDCGGIDPVKISEPEGLREEVFAAWQVRDAERLAIWQEELNSVTGQSQTVASTGFESVTGQSADQFSEPDDFVTGHSIDTDIEDPVTSPTEIKWGWIRKGLERVRVCWNNSLTQYKVLVDAGPNWLEMDADPLDIQWEA